MPESTLHVVAHIPAQADHVDEVRTILAGLIAPTRAEDGCHRYDLVQNAEVPTDFTFIEEWESDAHLDAHLQTPHVLNALNKVGRLLDGAPDIRRYARVG